MTHKTDDLLKATNQKLGLENVQLSIFFLTQSLSQHVLLWIPSDDRVGFPPVLIDFFFLQIYIIGDYEHKLVKTIMMIRDTWAKRLAFRWGVNCHCSFSMGFYISTTLLWWPTTQNMGREGSLGFKCSPLVKAISNKLQTSRLLVNVQTAQKAFDALLF